MIKNRYSVNTSDYIVGDSRTANDSYEFLLQFFQQYPSFANNPFWVCESERERERRERERMNKKKRI